MKKRSDNPQDYDSLREKIIGLGERSVRKSYYPKLQEQLRELEQTKEQLKQLSREQQLILESAGEGIFGLDLEGNYTFMNKAAVEMLGYKPGELIGRHSHSCIHYIKPDGTAYPEQECKIYAAFREGLTRHVDNECFCRKDGSQVPVEYTSTPVRENGEITGAVVTFSDITERKRAEEALRTSEENYRTIFNSANDAIAIQDIETATVLDVNPKALEMFGYTREEAIGIDIAAVSAGTPGFTKQDAKTWIRRAIESGPQVLEWYSKKKNGELFWIEVNIKPVVLQGQLRLLSIFRDITERKRVEEALRTSEENYRSIFDNANDAIFVHDIDTGEVISINRKTEEMFGRSLDELRDFGNQAIFTDVPGYSAKDALQWIRKAAEGKPQMFEWFSERKNGELFWIEVNLKRAVIGGKQRLLAIVRETTERKRVEEALRESEWRLTFATTLANEAIWDWDLAADRVTRNPVYEKMFGLPPDGVSSVEWWKSRIHPEDRDRVVSDFTAVVEGRTDDLNVEYRFLVADGTWGTVHDRAKVIRSSQGKPVRIVGTMQNITERKEVENRIRQSESNLRKVMDSVYDAIFIHKLDGTIIDVNRKMLELYQVDREQALRSRILEEFSAPDNPFENVPGIWGRAVSGENQLFEWKAKRPKDGSIFDVEVFLTRIPYGPMDVILANVRDITERKKAEEMKGRLSAIVETAEDAIISENRDGIIQTWNRGAQKIYGYTPEEITGKSQSLLVPPDKKHELEYILQIVSRGEHLDHYETERIRRDGSRFHASLSVSPIKDDRGRITGCSIIAHDITERVRAQEELKLTQFSVDNASVSAFLMDKEGHFLHVNKHACRTLGYNCADLRALSYPDLDPSFSVSTWPAHWDELKKAGSLHFQTRHRKRDGAWVSMEMSANYVSFGGREYNWAFGQDISERKRTEEQLLESEQRFRQLAENTDQVFWFMIPDPEKILYVSPAVEKIWGVPVERFYDDARLWAKMIHSDDQDRIEEAFFSWFSGKSGSFDEEYRIVRPDGAVHWIRDRGTAVRDTEGKLIRLSGIADDITDRKRIEQEVSRTKELLEEAQHIAGVGNWEWDVQNNRLSWSDEIFRIFGMKRGEFKETYEAFMETVHPDDRPTIEESLADAARERKERISNEFRIMRPDGSIRIVYTKVRIEFGNRNEIVGTRGTAQDVTEARRVEEALRLTQFSVDHASVSAFIVARDARFIYVNQEASRALGYTREELLSLSVPDIDLDFPASRWDDHWNQLKREGSLHFEANQRKKDGTLLPVDLTLNFVTFGGKEYNVAFSLDISERKRAENELNRSYNLTRTIIDSMNDAVSLIDVRNYRIVSANNVFLKSYGYSEVSEVVGKHCYELTHNRPDVCSAPDDICPLVETVKTKDHFSVDHIHYDRQGNKIYVEVSTSPIKDEAGNVMQVVHVQRNITERKLAEESLRESEERFRAFFESAAMGAAEVDPDTRRFVQVNDRLCEITGYPREELVLKTAYEITHPDDREQDSREFERAKRGEIREHAIVKRYIRKDRRVVWVDVSGSIIRDRDGRPIRAVGIIQDVTERRRAVESLRESEERFRAFFESAAVGAVEADPATGRYLRVNDRFCKIMGYSREEILSKRVFDLTHPDDRKNDFAFFEKIRKREIRELTAEKRYVHKDGHTIWGHVSVAVIHDSFGRPVRTAAIIQDTTARKRAEEALRRSEEFLRRVLDNLIAFVAVLDKNGVLIEVNRSALEVAGISSADVLGKSFFDTYWFAGSADAQGLVREAIQKGLSGEVSRFDMEVRIARGAPLPIDFMLASVRDEQGRITNLIASAIDITDRKRMEDEIKHMAHHDPLTGLPNRRLFRDIIDLELAQARRNRKKMAVLFLDLDRFKHINDTLGHEAGDSLLQQVAERLRGTIRTSDSVARIGGDEFNIILSDIIRGEDVSDICRKIVDSLRERFILGIHSLDITTSIGISIYPDDSTDAEDLLRYADIAMYYAKESGRNTFRFYNSSINVSSLERIKLENWLRQAVQRHELTVHYQPQVDIRSGKVKYAEALVRWNHPERGLLEPGEFIPLSEETGFITTIDEWVLRTVCAQGRAWKDEGLDSLCVTVNLSTRQFQSPDLVQLIKTIIRETGLSARCLDIEITESLAMKDVERSASQLRELREMGVHISVDDFGTGYSSLNYLKKLPIERIKIDKSFIRDIATDPDDRAIITAVTSMAHKMGIRTVAEGVETEEQFSFLKESDCDEVQGFLISRPVPADQFRQLIKTFG